MAIAVLDPPLTAGGCHRTHVQRTARWVGRANCWSSEEPASEAPHTESQPSSDTVASLSGATPAGES